MQPVRCVTDFRSDLARGDRDARAQFVVAVLTCDSFQPDLALIRFDGRPGGDKSVLRPDNALMDAFSVDHDGSNTRPVRVGPFTGDRFGNHADMFGRINEPGVIFLVLLRLRLRSAA